MGQQSVDHPLIYGGGNSSQTTPSPTDPLLGNSHYLKWVNPQTHKFQRNQYFDYFKCQTQNVIGGFVGSKPKKDKPKNHVKFRIIARDAWEFKCLHASGCSKHRNSSVMSPRFSTLMSYCNMSPTCTTA